MKKEDGSIIGLLIYFGIAVCMIVIGYFITWGIVDYYDNIELEKAIESGDMFVYEIGQGVFKVYVADAKNSSNPISDVFGVEQQENFTEYYILFKNGTKEYFGSMPSIEFRW